MNSTTTNWFLAGALIASLGWNAKGWLCAAPTSSAESAPSCLPAPDLSNLGLSAEQTHALESWRTNSCAPSFQCDVDADAKLMTLHTALRDPAATPEHLRDLAAQINRLRAHSLDTCVDSILEVRRVLSKEQLGALMQCCDPSLCKDQ